MEGSNRLLVALMLLLGTVPALAGNDVIGTVELELAGGSETWYVLRPDGDMLPTAVWLAMGPDQGALTIAAYEDPDLEFVRDEQTGSAVPADAAPVLILGIGFPVGAAEQRYELPSSEVQFASVLLLENWSEPLGGFSLMEDPGVIHLTEIAASRSGASRFAGTFSGVLRRDEETKTLRGATFRVDGVPFVAPEAN